MFGIFIMCVNEPERLAVRAVQLGSAIQQVHVRDSGQAGTAQTAWTSPLRSPLRLGLLLCVALSASLVVGCDKSGTSSNHPRCLISDPPQRQELEPTRTHRGLTGRSVLLCPAGNCIVMHYSLRADFEPNTKQILEKDTPNGSVASVFRQDGNQWSMAWVDTPTTFNCCTFAVGDYLGLTPRDWIEPRPHAVTYFTNPMQVILDSYFRLVKSYPRSALDWSKIAEDDSLREDDVLCFWLGSTQSRNPGREVWPEIVHAGKVRKRAGQNWLLSKIRSGPIVLATIRATAAQFDDQFDEIRIYRINK